jgi:GR25 family glycosyltransferase involved in LPS biosynthesis
MKFFITHYTPLVDRKEHIIHSLHSANIRDFEFVEVYDKEALTKLDTDKFAEIKLSEISLFLKHVDIYKKHIDDVVVVLEDDAVLVDNFKEKLDYYLDAIYRSDSKWDILFTGECCNLHAVNSEKQIFHKLPYSRGMSMYVLNTCVCTKLHSIFDNEQLITKPIDHWFNYIIPKYNLNTYWTEPTLVFQGSEIGYFKSAIR